MKKIKILSVLLLLLSTAAFIAFNVYMNMIVDDEPPVVTCQKKEKVVSIDVTEKELLRGVKAKDNRSGDVTDSLMVEKMSAFSDDGKRVVTYAAVDDSGNVGRCEQTIIYEGYDHARFNMDSSLCFKIGRKIDLLSNITAESVLDGDLTGKIKYALKSSINTSTVGNYPIEYRVMDSGGKVVYLNTYVEVCEASELAFEVYLTDYLVYLNVGDWFSAETYFAGSEREGTLYFNSDLDVQTPGTYYVDYIVYNGSVSGKARLVVVVE